MKKLKIVVYAICKNEEKNVYLWYESMREADEIVVLDTGSSDRTFEILSKLPKVKAYREIIEPWRFDVARNASLKYVPKDADICVCTDLDEVFKKGWSDILRRNWKKGMTKVFYTYNWGFNESGKVALSFYAGKIHSRNDYVWVHPVHEVLMYKNKRKKERRVLIKAIVLNHHRDKKKSRSSYFDLLKLAVEENPSDRRDNFLLTREYYFRKDWENVIKTANNYFKLESKLVTEEAMALCYLGIAYYRIGNESKGYSCLFSAHRKCLDFREPLYFIGKFLYEEKRYEMALKYFEKALEIDENKHHSYMMIETWGYKIYEYCMCCAFFKGDLDKALEYSRKAIDCNEKNKSLRNEYDFIKKVMKLKEKKA